MTRYGADLKQKIMASLKSTWSTISDFAKAHKSSQEEIEKEVDSAISEFSVTTEDEKAETECKKLTEIELNILEII